MFVRVCMCMWVITWSVGSLALTHRTTIAAANSATSHEVCVEARASAWARCRRRHGLIADRPDLGDVRQGSVGGRVGACKGRPADGSGAGGVRWRVLQRVGRRLSEVIALGCLRFGVCVFGCECVWIWLYVCGGGGVNV